MIPYLCENIDENRIIERQFESSYKVGSKRNPKFSREFFVRFLNCISDYDWFRNCVNIGLGLNLNSRNFLRPHSLTPLYIVALIDGPVVGRAEKPWKKSQKNFSKNFTQSRTRQRITSGRSNHGRDKITKIEHWKLVFDKMNWNSKQKSYLPYKNTKLGIFR